MNFGAAIAAFLTISAGAAAAQVLADARADRVIAGIEGFIGRDPEARAASLVARAHVIGPNGTFTTETRSIIGGDMAFLQIHPDGQTRGGVRAGAAWAIDEATGDVVAGDRGLAAFFRGHEFHLHLLALRSRYADHAFAGRINFHGCDCVEIRMTDEFGGVSVFADRETGAPYGMQYRLDIRETPIDVIYRDWLIHGGARLFSRLTITDDDDFYTYQYNHLALQPPGEAEIAPEALRKDG